MYVVAPFVPDRFQSTVPFYVEHRLRYPEALLAHVCRSVGLTRRDRVLDLGCGPGSLTIDLARYGAGDVIGFDPDAAMLAAARDAAAEADVAVTFVAASSYDLSPALGEFKLVTMGRSFHWMDRVATLAALDAVVDPEGAVVIISEVPEPARENGWKQIVKDVQYQFTGAPRGGSRHHAAVLLDSAFSSIEVYGLIKRGYPTLDSILGRALSELESSPEALGDRIGAFEAELRARLSNYSPRGEFSEVVHFGALIARRPAGARSGRS